MFTNWEQVKNWIEDNGFLHWVVYTRKPDERDSKGNDILIDSNNYPSDMGDKLAMTEKYLKMQGANTRLWAVGFKKPMATQEGLLCEVRLEDVSQASVNGAPVGYPSIGELTEQISKQIRAEMAVEAMKQREKDIERREKELEEKENSAMGAIVKIFAPVGQAMLEKKLMPRVAGVDTQEPVHAAPIVPTTEQPENKPEEQEQSAWDAFTEEEGEQIAVLMKRFKAVEPDYLQLIESVVTMAENGDSTYTMAKGFLVK